MAKKAFFLTKFPLPRTAVALGRLVTTPHNPLFFFDPQERLPNQPSPAGDHTDIVDISRLIEVSYGTKLEFALTSFASAFFDVQTSSARQLSACRATKYFMFNDLDWLDLICQEETTQEWLERQEMRGLDIYLITEYCTLTNPSSSVSKELTASVGGKVQPPVMAIGGAPVSVSAEPHGSCYLKESYRVNDEKVFWVACKKVKISRQTSSSQAYKLANKTKWVEICSIKDPSVDIAEITAELVDIDTVPNVSCVETEEENVFFTENPQP